MKTNFKKVHTAKDLCRGCRQQVLDFLAGKDVDLDLKEGNEGGSIRMDVYFDTKAGVAYVQVFNFSDYSYEPATGIVELHSPRADKLISQIR